MISGTPPILRWRYTLYGDVRHYVNVKDGRALCGLWPNPQGTTPMWLGNASKEEIYEIMHMHPCKHCLKAIPK